MEEVNAVLARCFSASKLSEMLAYKLALSDSDRITVTLGALFIEIGKLMMLLYRAKSGAQIDEDLIERHYPAVNVKIVEKFRLPADLYAIVSRPPLRFVNRLMEGRLIVNAAVSPTLGDISRTLAGGGARYQFTPALSLEGKLDLYFNDAADTDVIWSLVLRAGV